MLDLDDRIPTHPDDVDGWAVFADLLARRGDPRGTLVNLHLAAEHDPRMAEVARKYIFEHRAYLLGPLADRTSQWVIDWHRGHIRRLDMTVEVFCGGATDIICHLAQTGGLRALEHLRLIGSANFDAVLQAVIDARLTRLTVLDVGPINIGAGRMTLAVQSVLDALPRLHRLRIQMPEDLNELRHATLRTLRVAGFAETFAGVSLRGLPQLKTLELYSRTRVSAAQFAGIRAAPIKHIELHDETDVGWLEAAGPRPEHIVLHGPSADATARARALDVPTAYGRTQRGESDFALTPARQRTPRAFVKHDRFWRIHREHAALVLQYGKIGRAGRTLSRQYVNAYEASRDYCVRHAKKLDEGYTEVFAPSP